MWYPRDPLPPNHGRYPPPTMHSTQRPVVASHTRRQSTSFYVPANSNPPTYVAAAPQYDIQAPQRQSMTHSFSAPWNGLSTQEVGPSIGEVRVRAPQDLDGDVINYEGSRDDDLLKRVYAYQPTAYWAGRLSSLLDRFAAEYPYETRAWRIKRTLKCLNANAYGEGAKHSLDDFKETFERKIRSGAEW